MGNSTGEGEEVSGGSLCSAPREQVGAHAGNTAEASVGLRPKGRAHLDNREVQGQSRGVTSQTGCPPAH